MLPVGGVADLLVLFELVADHLQELVRVSTEVLHETHQILDGLLDDHSALEKHRRAVRNKGRFPWMTSEPRHHPSIWPEPGSTFCPGAKAEDLRQVSGGYMVRLRTTPLSQTFIRTAFSKPLERS